MSESGFDPGLSDPARAGVYFVSADDLPMLEMAARDAGLRPARIDLQRCTGKATLMLRMAMALAFPPGSGRNWDALSDLLRDLDWLDAPGGHVLLFEAASDLRDADEVQFETLLSILEESSAAWREAGIPFWAFLALPEQEFDAAPEMLS